LSFAIVFVHLSKEKVNTLKEELVFVATDSSTVAAVVVGRKAGKKSILGSTRMTFSATCQRM
jgi:hypothetical protein